MTTITLEKYLYIYKHTYRERYRERERENSHTLYTLNAPEAPAPPKPKTLNPIRPINPISPMNPKPPTARFASRGWTKRPSESTESARPLDVLGEDGVLGLRGLGSSGLGDRV